MKILFVRHGEADFGVVDKRGYIGMGRQFAPLTELGKLQANRVADNSLFSSSEIIVSSPYTRALQTAAAIARETVSEMISRTKTVLDRYVDEGYKKIIVVTHCRVIQRYTGTPVIGYCEVQEVDYNKNFSCYNWV